jgi:hypothetical protein
MEVPNFTKYRKNKQKSKGKFPQKRNPPPLTLSYALSGDEGPTVYMFQNTFMFIHTLFSNLISKTIEKISN